MNFFAHKNHVVCLWLILSVLFIFPSCVTTQEDILYLNNQIKALNNRVTRLQESMDKKISTGLDPMRESQAETGAEIDKIKVEIQNISGRVADNHQLVKRAIERDLTEQDSLKASLPELKRGVAELESKVKHLYGYLGLEPTGEIGQQAAPKGPQKAAPPPAGRDRAQSSEKELYDDTLGAYKEGKYEEAIVGFRGFVKKYPKSDLADNAQFWIGECYMALKQHEQAILAYQEVIKKYPKGNKVPNALLRQALAFYEIKDKTSSRLLLKRIIKKYPRSSEAKIAKAKLKTIK